MKEEKLVWTAGVEITGQWTIKNYPVSSVSAQALLTAGIGFTSEKIAKEYMNHCKFIANCLTTGEKNNWLLLLHASYAKPVKNSIKKKAADIRKKKVVKKVTKVKAKKKK